MQASLPTGDSALILLFNLVASGQVKLRRIPGYKVIAKMLRQQCSPSARRPTALDAPPTRNYTLFR